MPRPQELFEEPPWQAPLDPLAVIERVPETATIKGMFLSASVARAQEAGAILPSARASYTAFRSYPLREHCTLLVEMARALWPEAPLRQGLRRIGRGAAHALVGSTLGRVMVGSADGPTGILREMAKAFSLVSVPGTISLVHTAPGEVILALRDIHFFLDSHHVGVYEGALRFAEAPEASVRIRIHSPHEADFRCTWRVP